MGWFDFEATEKLDGFLFDLWFELKVIGEAVLWEIVGFVHGEEFLGVWGYEFGPLLFILEQRWSVHASLHLCHFVVVVFLYSFEMFFEVLESVVLGLDGWEEGV